MQRQKAWHQDGAVALDRRRFLFRLAGAGLMAGAGLSAVNPARAQGGNPEDPKLRFVQIPPMLLPGNDRFAYVRLKIDLVVRQTPEIVQDVELVNAYKPRIIGMVTEQLPQENLVDRHSGPEEVNRLKGRLREIANAAIGKDVVEDVLIQSLLTG